MSLFAFLRDIWRSLFAPVPRPCRCDDPRLNAVGGFKRGCPVHDPTVSGGRG